MRDHILPTLLLQHMCMYMYIYTYVHTQVHIYKCRCKEGCLHALLAVLQLSQADRQVSNALKHLQLGV